VALEGATVAVRVTGPPNVDGFGLLVRLVVVLSLLTVCSVALELLAASFASPA
jgi:hypothetical protein